MVATRTHDVRELTWVIAGLNGFVNDSVTNAQSVEVEGNSWEGAVLDFLVVLIEQVKECRAVVLDCERIER